MDRARLAPITQVIFSLLIAMGWQALYAPAIFGQPSSHPVSEPPSRTPGQLPAFDVISIKPANPKGGPVGVFTYPGGKVYVSQYTLRMLIEDAFQLQSFQVSGGPPWIDDDRYDIVGLPPDGSKSRQSRPVSIKAAPNDEQLKMLQTLLIQRFGLKFHTEVQQGSVYLLVRSDKKLQMTEPKDKNGLPFLLSLLKPGGIADGAMTGNNISMPLFAERLSRYLQRPVIDQTGLKGSFDFELPASDPTNQDVTAAILDSISRLGLRLKGGKGPIKTLVIENATKPETD